MNTLQDLIRAETVYRLGWALLHSLWLGAAVAALLAVVLAALRRRSAQARYAAACVALVLMVATPAVVLPLVAGPADAARAGHSVSLSPISEPSGPIVQPDTARDPATPDSSSLPVPTSPAVAAPSPTAYAALSSLLARASRTLEPAMPWLTLAWMAGVLVLSVWRLSGWMFAVRLRRLAEPVDDATLIRRLERLARALRVSRPVRLLESAMVRVPAVIGWLKPAILLPAGLATGLSPDQMAALLAHELAHIRRHDYFVNILQSLAETTLFYHPAVWWVSRRIRLERENCCDDLAVAAGSECVGYAELLIELADRAGRGAVRPRAAAAMVGATGPAAQLRHRIARLIGRPDVRDDARSGWLAAVVALATLCIGLAIGMGCLGDRATSEPAWMASERHDLAQGIREWQKDARGVDDVRLDLTQAARMSDRTLLAGGMFATPASSRRSVLLVSQDNGHTWRDSGLWQYGSIVTDLFVLDDRHAWAVVAWAIEGTLPPYYVYRTTDGGHSWQRSTTPLPEPADAGIPDLLALGFTDADRGWAVFRQDVIGGSFLVTYRTSDGGLTWRESARHSADATANGFRATAIAADRVVAIEQCSDDESRPWQTVFSLPAASRAADLQVNHLWRQQRTRIEERAADADRWRAISVLPSRARRMADDFAIAPPVDGAADYVASAASAPATLELRIAPAADALDAAELKTCRDWLAEGKTGLWWKGGRIAGRMPEYAWLPIRDELPNADRLITGQHDGTTCLLVSDRPGEAMSSDDTGADMWRLTSIAVAADPTGLPVLAFNVDARGGERLSALTAANLRRTLAIVVDGEVVSAPVIMSRLSTGGLITGHFSPGDVEELADALRPLVRQPDLASQRIDVARAALDVEQKELAKLKELYRLGRATDLDVDRQALKVKQAELQLAEALADAGGLPGKDSDLGVWGQAVDGVQVRLRAEKTDWDVGATPKLLADVRNGGQRDLSVAQAQELAEIEVDGQWHVWRGAIDVKSSWFPPDRQYDNIPFMLESSWVTKDGNAALVLKPGKHSVHVAFICLPNEKGALEPPPQPVRVVSNAVDINIVSGEFFVDGDVPRRGVYTTAPGNVTLTAALRAAGMTLPPDRIRVTITRREGTDKESSFEVPLADILARRAPDPIIQAGDLIRVKNLANEEAAPPVPGTDGAADRVGVVWAIEGSEVPDAKAPEGRWLISADRDAELILSGFEIEGRTHVIIPRGDYARVRMTGTVEVKGTASAGDGRLFWTYRVAKAGQPEPALQAGDVDHPGSEKGRPVFRLATGAERVDSGYRVLWAVRWLGPDGSVGKTAGCVVRVVKPGHVDKVPGPPQGELIRTAVNRFFAAADAPKPTPAAPPAAGGNN